MLVFYTAIWSILRLFGIVSGHLVYFVVICYILPVLVCCTYKEKSGNPGVHHLDTPKKKMKRNKTIRRQSDVQLIIERCTCTFGPQVLHSYVTRTQFPAFKNYFQICTHNDTAYLV
jgi:hypothetical protein